MAKDLVDIIEEVLNDNGGVPETVTNKLVLACVRDVMKGQQKIAETVETTHETVTKHTQELALTSADVKKNKDEIDLLRKRSNTFDGIIAAVTIIGNTLGVILGTRN